MHFFFCSMQHYFYEALQRADSSFNNINVGGVAVDLRRDRASGGELESSFPAAKTLSVRHAGCIFLME